MWKTVDSCKDMGKDDHGEVDLYAHVHLWNYHMANLIN